MASSGSELEKRILEDGKVTPAELEESALALVECDSAQGLTTTMEDDGEGAFNFSIPTSEKNLRIHQECNAKTYANVDIIHAIQNTLPAEVQERQAQLVVDCLNENGFAVEEWPNVGIEIDRAVESDCVDEANQILAE